jgi:hypothetical protein
MPPLAVIGFGLATLNWTVFSGALLLYFTNLMTIALTSAVMARIYGFRTNLSPKHTVLQNVVIAVAFLALTIPLTLALWRVAREANDSRVINSGLRDAFDGKARVSQIDIDFRHHPIRVNATVLTPKLRPNAERDISLSLRHELGEPIDVNLTQFQVGTGAQAAEVAQLGRARAQERADVEHAETLAARLALIAGVSADDVLVDRERQTATVAARPLDGASLAAYRELEARIAAGEDGWTIRLRPPARPLPAVEFSDGSLTEGGARALELIAWAGERVTAPIELRGPAKEVDFVAGELAQKGVAVLTNRGGRGETVTAAWGAPGD